MWVRRLEVSASILITGHQRSIFFKNTDDRERLKQKTLIWNACLSNAIIKSHWCSGTVGTWKLVLCSSTDLNYSCGFIWKSRKAQNYFFFFLLSEDDKSCFFKITAYFSMSKCIIGHEYYTSRQHLNRQLMAQWWSYSLTAMVVSLSLSLGDCVAFDYIFPIHPSIFPSFPP